MGFITLLFANLIILGSSKTACTISIDNQEQFDDLQSLLDTAISKGYRTITVNLVPGHYYYSENHLAFINKNLPKVTVAIKGNGAFLTGKGVFNPTGEAFRLNSSYLIKDSLLTSFSSVYKAKSVVTHVKGTLYKIKCPKLPGTARKADYIKLTEAYNAHNYPVEKIRRSTVFFHAESPEWLNMDFTFAKQMPRFKLSVCPTGKNVFRSDVCCFMYFYCSSFKSVSVEGVYFTGNANLKYMSLIRTIELKCEQFKIEQCSFNCLMGNLMEAQKTSNIFFINNKVTYCNGFGLTTDAYCDNTRVLNNTFYYTGLGMGPTFCVCVRGNNYLVQNNVFCNFGYCAIAAGVYYADEIPTKSCGIIEKNTIYYDSDYLSDIENYQVMDGGAIYLFTRNDKVLIRNNTIHDIDGRYQNRGIFCDDGACGFEICHNTIYNIKNSYCIDSRRVKEIESDVNPNSKVRKTNINNTMYSNNVDGRIRFEVRDK